jgi:very-short-patch-repair endonuclease
VPGGRGIDSGRTFFELTTNHSNTFLFPKLHLSFENQMDEFNFYNKGLKTYARKNRSNGTKAEACLWKFILKAKKTGYQFNRQRPVLNYIADFMCVKLKLIIEVDGYTHLQESVVKNDIVRQKRLEDHGFTVIRFKDEDVLLNIDYVHKRIMSTIQELEKTMLAKVNDSSVVPRLLPSTSR